MTTEYKQRILTDSERESYRLAEESLLGAILIDAADSDDSRATINRISQIVQPSDFQGYKQGYDVTDWQCREARIYSAMLSCPTSPHIVNVATELVSRKLSKPGDCAFMSHCGAECPNSYDVDDYAVTVRYFSQLKNSVESGGRHLEFKKPYKGLEI